MSTGVEKNREAIMCSCEKVHGVELVMVIPNVASPLT